MQKNLKTRTLLTGFIISLLVFAAAIILFLPPKQDSSVAQAEDFVAAHPDVSVIYTSKDTQNLQVAFSQQEQPEEKSSPIVEYNENQASHTAAASPKYVLRVSAGYDIIYLYDITDQNEPLQVYDFSDRRVPLDDYFINQLSFADEDTFAFLSYETEGESAISELHVFNVDSTTPVSVTGEKVQKWSSMVVENKLYFNYVDTLSGSFANSGSSVNVLQAGEKEPFLTIPQAGTNSGLFWDGLQLNAWWQDVDNRLSIVDVADATKLTHTTLAAAVDEPVIFIANDGSQDIVGLESGIYAFTNNTLTLKHAFETRVPIIVPAKINITKGFITQSYRDDESTQSSSIYSLSDETLTWVDSYAITVW